MEPISFPDETRILNPPSTMKEEECGSIPVALLNYSNYLSTMSCWKPTKEELEEINKTGRIYLVCLGSTMPPSIVFGYNPLIHDDVTLAEERL